MFRKTLNSTVPGHEGPCWYTWLNTNRFCRRTDRENGYSGFFRRVRVFGPFRVKFGPEFHGVVTLHTGEKNPTVFESKGYR